jgi:Holliday junction resolvase
MREKKGAKMNSIRKGKVGERELAKKLKEYGYDCRRGQQYNGIDGEDVVGLAGIHIECKRVERLQLTDAMLQSARDAKDKDVPVVMHRKDHEKWYVTMTLENWIEFYGSWLEDCYQNGIDQAADTEVGK